MLTRRTALRAGGLLLAGLAAPPIVRAIGAAAAVEIRMRATADGSDVWFDPVGIFVERGQTVRWIVEHDVHTTTAYHPRNDNHPLRIPEGAEPWDSGFLMDVGSRFEITPMVEGVYDYYCAPHEIAGMVGRLVVGRAVGPGTRPLQAAIPEAARRAFPAPERIVAERIVRRTGPSRHS